MQFEHIGIVTDGALVEFLKYKDPPKP